MSIPTKRDKRPVLARSCICSSMPVLMVCEPPCAAQLHLAGPSILVASHQGGQGVVVLGVEGVEDRLGHLAGEREVVEEGR